MRFWCCVDYSYGVIEACRLRWRVGDSNNITLMEETQTNKQTNIHTDRQTDRQTYGQTDNLLVVYHVRGVTPFVYAGNDAVVSSKQSLYVGSETKQNEYLTTPQHKKQIGYWVETKQIHLYKTTLQLYL